MKADLHVHSTASDGTVTPSALVTLALDRDIDVLAISDHDSLEGVPEALASAQGTSLTVIPAVELSASSDGRDLHLLGYFVSLTDGDLLGALAEMREARARRAEKMVRVLAHAGYQIDSKALARISRGGAIGRSHVARALVQAGAATDVRDAFQRLIGHGRPFYVKKEPLAPKRAIEILRSAGGLPVLAHPGVTKVDDLIGDLVAMGLGGIEAYHADHSAEDREHYAALAASLGLLTTGGSDFHGPQSPNPQLGAVDVPSHVIESFLDWGASRGV